MSDGGNEAEWEARGKRNAAEYAKAEAAFFAELDRRLAEEALTDFEKRGGTTLEALKRELGL